jgi:hypothetical protein
MKILQKINAHKLFKKISNRTRRVLSDRFHTWHDNLSVSSRNVKNSQKRQMLIQICLLSFFIKSSSFKQNHNNRNNLKGILSYKVNERLIVVFGSLISYSYWITPIRIFLKKIFQLGVFIYFINNPVLTDVCMNTNTSDFLTTIKRKV